MNTPKLTIGERLKDLRTSHKLTSKDVCNQLDKQFGYSLSIGKYNEIERDEKKDFGYRAFLYLARLFNVSVDYLIGNNETSSPDYSIQTVHYVTGLSESAISELAAMKDTPDDKSYHTIVSALLEDISFERVIALIDAKIKLQTVPDNEYDKYEQLFENWKSIKISGEEYHVETPVLLDSLIQGEFLKVVNDACKRMEG